MANGDKDDKKKKRAEKKENVRVLRPRGSGATTSLGEVAEGTRKFFTETVPKAGKAAGTAVIEAFQPSVAPTGPVVDFQYEDKEEGDGETYEEVEADLIRRTAGGRAKDDSDDFTPKPKFFDPMGRSVTAPAGNIAPYQQERKEAATLKAFGPPRERKQSLSPDQQEAARNDLAFDSDGDGILSASEREDARAFKREERIRGYKESTERNKAKFAEISARLEARRKQASDLERKEDQALIDKMGDELTAKVNAQQKQDRRKLFATVRSLSDQGKLDTDTYNKLKAREGGLVGVSPEQFDRTFERAGIIPMDTPAQVGGLRRKDFGSTAGFLTAVRGQQDTPSGSAAAAQKVMDSRGLGREKAMQSGSYQLGSGSSLRKTPVELGTRSGAMNRAGRRLLNKGASGEAFKMFGAAEVQRDKEGSRIETPERRAMKEAERRTQRDLAFEATQRQRRLGRRRSRKRNRR